MVTQVAYVREMRSVGIIIWNLLDVCFFGEKEGGFCFRKSKKVLL